MGALDLGDLLADLLRLLLEGCHFRIVIAERRQEGRVQGHSLLFAPASVLEEITQGSGRPGTLGGGVARAACQSARTWTSCSPMVVWEMASSGVA